MSKVPRTFILSQRNRVRHVSRCAFYEFEDLVTQFEQADLFSPIFPWDNLFYNSIRKITDCTKLGNFFHPMLQQIVLEKKYDIFFACFQSPSEILALMSVSNWRKKCKIAIAWVDELWLQNIDKWGRYFELLKEFDYIFMTFETTLKVVSSLYKYPCHPISYGVDSLTFSPRIVSNNRAVDIYNIGRRSHLEHQLLREISSQKDYFYIYDTIKPLFFDDYREHRNLYAETLKRSRYFIVNKAKFNEVGITGNQEELGPRFFEGIAAGAVLLGQPPNCLAFKQHFNWVDAVIPIEVDAGSIARTLDELDESPEKLLSMRERNIANALLRHDWVYRWQYILETIGLEQTQSMIVRKKRLEKLSMLPQIG